MFRHLAGAVYHDRREAGQKLAEELQPHADRNPAVLGVPRGGVVVAAEIAHALHADLDVIIPKKLGAPGNPELAIGAVTEGGDVFLNEDLVSQLAVSSAYIEEEKRRKMVEIERRVSRYRQVKRRIELADRVVIVTDDGVATGATMQAALQGVSAAKPTEVILALPVAPAEALAALEKVASRVICLHTPNGLFGGIGAYYQDFSQTTDQEVITLLKEFAER